MEAKTNHIENLIISLLAVVPIIFNSNILQAQNVKDADGNTYNSIRIGTQVWMNENLKTTKFNDETNIPLVTDFSSWKTLSSPAYCWYNNDTSVIRNKYGALYNWYTVNTNKLCPKGWHVPSDKEWEILSTFLGGDSIAGSKLKEAGTVHWEKPNTEATNESGFTALPGGYRNNRGMFESIGSFCFWWSATEHTATDASGLSVGCIGSDFTRISSLKKNGSSVRCIKDH